MKAIKWLSLEMVLAIHDEAVHFFGGLGGVREQSLLESAIDKPRNKLAYEPKSSLFALAAVLGVGLARTHAFNDGNKRTALLAMRAFLFLNGRLLEPREDDEVITIIGVATGDVTELRFAEWLEKNCAVQRAIAKTRSRVKPHGRTRKKPK